MDEVAFVRKRLYLVGKMAAMGQGSNGLWWYNIIRGMVPKISRFAHIRSQSTHIAFPFSPLLYWPC